MMNTDMDEVERGLKEAISAMLESISSAEKEEANIAKEEENLRVKVEKRKFELERSEKRLSTLYNVRYIYTHTQVHLLVFPYVHEHSL